MKHPVCLFWAHFVGRMKHARLIIQFVLIISVDAEIITEKTAAFVFQVKKFLLTFIYFKKL